MRETKTEAKTIQDAVEKGLTEMGMRRDQVEVVVVSEGTKGFLGFGAKKACVILREKRWTGGRGGNEPRDQRPGGRSSGRGPRRDSRGPRRDSRPAAAPRRPGRYGYEDARLPPPEEQHEERPQRDERPQRGSRSRVDRVYNEEPLGADYLAIQPAQDPVEHAKDALLKILTLMGLKATVTEASLDQAEKLLFLKFECDGSAAFTGENGQGLQALQFILNSIVSRKREPHLALRLDTGGYWDNKEKEIASRVEAAVKEVISRGQPFHMDPMPASIRKIVHNLVKSKYPEMETISEGESRWRKVVIRKIEKQAAAQQAIEPAAAQQAIEPAAAQQAIEPAAAQPEQQPAEQTTEQK